MAIAIQSDWVLGRKQVPTSREAGGVVAQRFEATIDVDMNEGDIVELAVLPAYHTVVDAILDTPVSLGSGVSADVGVMSGAVGDPDGTRTCGNELFNNRNMSGGVARANTVSAFTIAPADRDRSIGVKVSAAVTAGTTKKVGLVLLMVQ